MNEENRLKTKNPKLPYINRLKVLKMNWSICNYD